MRNGRYLKVIGIGSKRRFVEVWSTKIFPSVLISKGTVNAYLNIPYSYVQSFVDLVCKNRGPM